MPNEETAPVQQSVSIAIISSIAYSIANFRGPLIRTLRDQGITVYALAPDYDDNTRRAAETAGAIPVDFSLERVGMRPARDLMDLIRLVRLLRRIKPDVCLAYFIKPVIYGSLAAMLARVPRRFALVAGLGYVFTENGGSRKFKRRLLRRSVSLLYKLGFVACHLVFFQNEDDRAQLVEARLLPFAKTVRLNGTGVDLKRFELCPVVIEPITFLLMARLLHEKGIREYARAARIVKRSHPDVRILLLGGTDRNPGSLSEQTIAGWHDEGILEWHGHVDDVVPWIAQSSVYVLPSYREGVPRSTLEAMAMGRPVITTDAIGCRETVVDGVNGYLVPIRNSEALAQAMARFIQEPMLIKRMGMESRRIAEERFDVNEINAKLLRAMGFRHPRSDSPLSSTTVPR